MSCRTIAPFVLVLLAVNAFAAPASKEGGPPSPPPEAFTACEGKKAGDKAEFAGPQGRKIAGTCEREQNGDRLVLRPDRPLGPPPEAFTACEGKKAGDKAESATPDGRTITGICEERDGRLFLRPDHLPQGDEGGPQQNSAQKKGE